SLISPSSPKQLGMVSPELIKQLGMVSPELIKQLGMVSPELMSPELNGVPGTHELPFSWVQGAALRHDRLTPILPTSGVNRSHVRSRSYLPVFPEAVGWPQEWCKSRSPRRAAGPRPRPRP